MGDGEMLEGIPGEDWSLDDLARFCVLALRRSAEDKWKIGRALAIACDKHKAQKSWLKWLRANVKMSKSSAYRYMDVAKRLTWEQVQGLKPDQIKRLLDDARSEELHVDEVARTGLVGGDRHVLPLGRRRGKSDEDPSVGKSKRRLAHPESSGPVGDMGRQGQRPDGGGREDIRQDGGLPAWAVEDEGVEYEEVINDLAALRRSLTAALEVIRFQPPRRSLMKNLKEDMQDVSVLLRRLTRFVSSSGVEVA